MGKRNNPETLWDEIIKSVIEKKEISEASVENWLKPFSAVKYADGILFLETANNFAPQVVNARYKQKLCDIAKNIDEKFANMDFVVAGEIKINETPQKEIEAQENIEQKTKDQSNKTFFSHPVNKQYTFNNFINTYENQLAVSSALGIANSPGKMRQYNPFYIYGKAGVGKTHLLHAIANQILKNNPNARVVIISGTEFYRNYAVYKNKNDYDNYESIYEPADIILFDNIHELSGQKTATQLKLYNIFNKFHQHNKQIVFTANSSPSELSGIMERLVSRFQWGLTVKLDVANIETRRVILENMARKDKIKISNEEIDYIVENCSENIHILQGIVANIAVSASLGGTTITSDAVREALKNRKLQPVKGYHSPKTILEVVSSYYKIDLEDIKGKSRVAQIAWARHIAIYFLKKYTSVTLSAIGNELGGRSHATVLNSVEEVESRINEERISKEIKEISRKLARN
jgi:chromosomal replication initiator protein